MYFELYKLINRQWICYCIFVTAFFSVDLENIQIIPITQAINKINNTRPPAAFNFELDIGPNSIKQ